MHGFYSVSAFFLALIIPYLTLKLYCLSVFQGSSGEKSRHYLTFTVTVAVLPLLVFAVTVALPTPTAVILPFDTVATDLFDVVHVTVLFVAFVGAIVAVTVVLCPLARFTLLFESVIDSTGTMTFHRKDLLYLSEWTEHITHLLKTEKEMFPFGI